VRAILEDPAKKVMHYYGLLDRGGNMAKRMFTAHKRDTVAGMPDPEGRKFTVPSDGFLPKQEEWESIIANAGMTRREVYPLYKRALIDIYTPPPGKYVVIDGAPAQPLYKDEAKRLGREAFQHVYGCTTSVVHPGASMTMSGRDMLNTPVAVAPTTGRYECPPDIYRHDIEEADLSAFFHVHKHIRYPGCDESLPAGQIILIDSNDFDSVMIAILEVNRPRGLASLTRVLTRRQAPDRVEHGRFNSRVWIKLKGQERARVAAKKRKTEAEEGGKVDKRADDPIDGRDVYIDINELFRLMGEDEDLRVCQYPQGMAVLLYMMGGTDFFDDFIGDEHSLFHGMGWEGFIWNTWCAHKNRFPNLVMVFYTGPFGYNRPNVCRMPYIDEEAIVTFFHQCYAAKYGKAVRSMYNVDKPTPEQLREYTRSLVNTVKSVDDMVKERWVKKYRAAKKQGIDLGDQPPLTEDEVLDEEKKYQARLRDAKKKAMPPDAVLQRYARLALLNVSYWLNGYRPDGKKYCDPLEVYLGMPYYGYILDETQFQFKLSPIVSPPKPVPDTVTGYLGVHTRQEREEAEAVAERARAKAQREEAQQAARAKEEERLERQKKLAAKEKRLAQQERDAEVPVRRPPGQVHGVKRKG